MAKRLVSYRHTLINSSATFFSRVIGILKQNVINFLFGATGGDAFWQAYRFVNAFQRYIGEGAMTASFIPMFQKNLQNSDDPKAREKAFLFANNIFTLFLLINIAVTTIAAALAPFYVPVITPGYGVEPEKLKANIILTMLMMPYLIFISIYAVSMGILNSHKKFTASAVGPIFFNFAIILIPLFLVKNIGVYSLGIAVLIGVMLQCLGQVFGLRKIGFHYRFYLNLKDPDLKSFFRLFVPTTANMVVVTIKNILTGTFLTFYPGGMLINMNTYTIAMAPIGIVGIAIGNVLMPLLAGFKASGKVEHFEQSLSEALYLFIYTMVPIAVFCTLFPDTIVNTSYRDVMRLFTGHTGKYTQELLSQNYLALSIYGPALFSMGIVILFDKIFYARHDAKTPFWANVTTSVTSVLLYVLLCSPALLRYLKIEGLSFLPDIGMFGVILADVIASYFMLFYYAFNLKKAADTKTLRKNLLGRSIGVLAFSIIAALSVMPLYRLFYEAKELNAFLSIFTAILLFALFALIYYLMTRIAKIAVKR